MLIWDTGTSVSLSVLSAPICSLWSTSNAVQISPVVGLKKPCGKEYSWSNCSFLLIEVHVTSTWLALAVFRCFVFLQQMLLSWSRSSLGALRYQIMLASQWENSHNTNHSNRGKITIPWQQCWPVWGCCLPRGSPSLELCAQPVWGLQSYPQTRITLCCRS